MPIWFSSIVYFCKHCSGFNHTFKPIYLILIPWLYIYMKFPLILRSFVLYVLWMQSVACPSIRIGYTNLLKAHLTHTVVYSRGSILSKKQVLGLQYCVQIFNPWIGWRRKIWKSRWKLCFLFQSLFSWFPLRLSSLNVSSIFQKFKNKGHLPWRPSFIYSLF